MKKLTLITLVLLASCKKDTKPTGMQIQVSGLPTGSTLTIRATDDKEGQVLGSTTAANGNYTTTPVLPNDRITIYYDLSKPLSNDVTLKFFYKNEGMGAVGFFQSGSISESVPMP